MSIKRILVHLAPDPRNEVRLDLATMLASTHDAKVIGLFETPTHYVPSDLGTVLQSEIQAQLDRADTEIIAPAKAMFHHIMQSQGLRSEWRVARAPLIGQIEHHARYCDLTITGQDNPDNRTQQSEALAEHLALTAGTPVITVPYTGEFATIGTRIIVAWDRTRESTRAIHDAFPLLVNAEQVSICMVNPPASAHTDEFDIIAFLAEHGVNAEDHPTVSRRPKEETALFGSNSLSVGDLLLSAAFDFGADLLVMGAYGHSRLREFVFGGTTRYIFDHMTVPVLMSH